MGRKLLSAAFAVDVGSGVSDAADLRICHKKHKIKVKGGGQECPPHTLAGYTLVFGVFLEGLRSVFVRMLVVFVDANPFGANGQVSRG